MVGARASARSRLSSEAEALLIDDDAPSSSTKLVPQSSVVSVETPMRDLVNDTPMVSDFVISGASPDDSSGISMIIETLSRLSEVDKPRRDFAEVILRHMAAIAKKHDHCGLLGFAMSQAHRLGLRLRAFDNVSSACPGSELAAMLVDEATVPACVASYMASTRHLCVMRLICGGKVIFMPNALWSERVCSEADLNSWTVLPSITNYISRADLRRFMMFVLPRESALAPLTSLDGVIHDEPQPIGLPQPVRLRVRTTSSPSAGDQQHGQQHGGVFAPHRVSRLIPRDGGDGLTLTCVIFEPLVEEVSVDVAEEGPVNESAAGQPLAMPPSVVSGRPVARKMWPHSQEPERKRSGTGLQPQRLPWRRRSVNEQIPPAQVPLLGVNTIGQPSAAGSNLNAAAPAGELWNSAHELHGAHELHATNELSMCDADGAGVALALELGDDMSDMLVDWDSIEALL